MINQTKVNQRINWNSSFFYFFSLICTCTLQKVEKLVKLIDKITSTIFH